MKKIRDYAWPPNFDSYIELILSQIGKKKVQFWMKNKIFEKLIQ